MAEFTPITMKRKRDNQSRKVYSAAEQISAAFDGFVAPAPAAKRASKTTAASKATAKTTAKKAAAASPTGTAVTDGPTGK